MRKPKEPLSAQVPELSGPRLTRRLILFILALAVAVGAFTFGVRGLLSIESSLDAQKVADLTGVESIQIHNGGLCHIDADMTSRAIAQFGARDLDLLILENIGNLVCPAEFDTGAHKNVMLYSITEGDDKPLKYPLMFSVCDVILINKCDTLPVFTEFSKDAVTERIHKLNPNALVIFVSAKTGEGFEEWINWLRVQVSSWNKDN